MNLKVENIDTIDDCKNNLSVNLHSLLKTKSVSITQLSGALGIPIMTIRRLMSGETTDPRISTLKTIADYFEISVDSLVESKGQDFLKSLTSSKPQFVPILDWDTAERINGLNELDLVSWENWQSVNISQNVRISKNSFALESRPSMYPRFPEGSLFIIDPEVLPKDGDIVLIKIKTTHEITMREMRIDPPETLLKPLVSGSGVVLYSEEQHFIVGVNMLTIMYGRTR